MAITLSVPNYILASSYKLSSFKILPWTLGNYHYNLVMNSVIHQYSFVVSTLEA